MHRGADGHAVQVRRAVPPENLTRRCRVSESDQEGRARARGLFHEALRGAGEEGTGLDAGFMGKLSENTVCGGAAMEERADMFEFTRCVAGIGKHF